jgi:hypothetical protein
MSTARSPKLGALSRHDTLMGHSALEARDGVAGAERQQEEGGMDESAEDRVRLWLSVVCTIFGHQVLTSILHKQGRLLDAQCFLGINILRVRHRLTRAQ